MNKAIGLEESKEQKATAHEEPASLPRYFNSEQNRIIDWRYRWRYHVVVSYAMTNGGRMRSINSQPERWQYRGYRLEVWLITGFIACVCATTVTGGRSWDANALLVERARLDSPVPVADTHSVQVDESQTVFLEVEIRNKTGRDITLPPSIKIRETTKFSPSLKLSEFGLNGPVVLRAGGTTKVRIGYDLYCKVGRVKKDCIKRALGDIDQIIMFDGADNYEIRVPLVDAVDTFLTSAN